MRVIIVDDERLALRQFEMETEDMPGVEVAGAFTNPVDALAYVQEHLVEAAFLDIAMPGMNGLALAEKLREIRPDLVVIFLTGYEQYTLDALKVKADYYLTKPYNKQDITEALERAGFWPRGRKSGSTRAPSAGLMCLSTGRRCISPTPRPRSC